MPENNTSTSPVSLQEVCDYMGFLIDEVKQDKVIKRNLERLIKVADTYLKGAVSQNYPKEDERAKQIALLVISDLYEYREMDTKNISSTTKKILYDIEWQLKLELMKNGNEQTS